VSTHPRSNSFDEVEHELIVPDRNASNPDAITDVRKILLF
jgi:hypothetical protein